MRVVVTTYRDWTLAAWRPDPMMVWSFIRRQRREAFLARLRAGNTAALRRMERMG